MPCCSLPRLRQRGRRTLWTLAVAAVVVLAIGAGGLLAAAVDRVAKLTPAQEKRGVMSAIGHHSFAPPLLRQYYGDGEIPHWTISGSSIITDHYVRLTGDQKSQVGHLWNTEPLDMEAFEVVVGFRAFRPMGGMGADGFALWIAEPPGFDGPLFGRPTNFHGFGILFDSYDNDNRRDNPMVSLIHNDGSRKTRFDPDTDFMGQTASSCVFDYRGVVAPYMATMRMVFDHGDLHVYLSVNNEATETLCLAVSALSMPKQSVYLSFSAQTGAVSEIHDILFVHVSPLETASYTHDIRQTVVPEGEAGVYNNDAMNNRRTQPPPTQPPPTQPPQTQPPQTQPPQTQPPQTQPPQTQPPQTQPPPTQPPPTQPPPTQPPQTQPPQTQPPQTQPPQTQPPQTQPPQTQPPVPPQQAAETEAERIARLKRELAELERRNRRPTRPVDDVYEEVYEDDDEYEDEEVEQPRRVRRVRRARTQRRPGPGQ